MGKLTDEQIRQLRNIFYGNIEHEVKKPTAPAAAFSSDNLSQSKSEQPEHPFNIIRTAIKFFMTGHNEHSLQQSLQHQAAQPKPPYLAALEQEKLDKRKEAEGAGKKYNADDEEDDTDLIPKGNIPPYVDIMLKDYLDYLRKTDIQQYFSNLMKICNSDASAKLFNAATLIEFAEKNLNDLIITRSYSKKGARRRIIFTFCADCIDYIEGYQKDREDILGYYQTLDNNGSLRDKDDRNKKIENAKERRLAIILSKLYRSLLNLSSMNALIVGKFDGIKKPLKGYNLNSPKKHHLHALRPLYYTPRKNTPIEGTTTESENSSPSDAEAYLDSFVRHLLSKDVIPFFKEQELLLTDPKLTTVTGKNTFPLAFWADEDIESLTYRAINELNLLLASPTIRGQTQRNIELLRSALDDFIKFLNKASSTFTEVYKQLYPEKFWNENDPEFAELAKVHNAKLSSSLPAFVPISRSVPIPTPIPGSVNQPVRRASDSAQETEQHNSDQLKQQQRRSCDPSQKNTFKINLPASPREESAVPAAQTPVAKPSAATSAIGSILNSQKPASVPDLRADTISDRDNNFILHTSKTTAKKKTNDGKGEHQSGEVKSSAVPAVPEPTATVSAAPPKPISGKSPHKKQPSEGGSSFMGGVQSLWSKMTSSTGSSSSTSALASSVPLPGSESNKPAPSKPPGK